MSDQYLIVPEKLFINGPSNKENFYLHNNSNKSIEFKMDTTMMGANIKDASGIIKPHEKKGMQVSIGHTFNEFDGPFDFEHKIVIQYVFAGPDTKDFLHPQGNIPSQMIMEKSIPVSFEESSPFIEIQPIHSNDNHIYILEGQNPFTAEIHPRNVRKDSDEEALINILVAVLILVLALLLMNLLLF